jgi:hypothetical protein
VDVVTAIGGGVGSEIGAGLREGLRGSKAGGTPITRSAGPKLWRGCDLRGFQRYPDVWIPPKLEPLACSSANERVDRANDGLLVAGR